MISFYLYIFSNIYIVLYSDSPTSPPPNKHCSIFNGNYGNKYESYYEEEEEYVKRI